MTNISEFEDFSELQDNPQVCTRVCKECPFSKNSPKGWLADYTVQDIDNIMANEGLFPCHMLIPEELGDKITQRDVRASIESGEMKLCRGYIESMIKSSKLPKYNEILRDAMLKVRAEGLSDVTMPIWDFNKYHATI